MRHVERMLNVWGFRLDLDRNRFTVIPEGFSSLTKLRSLRLQNNALASLADLPAMTWLKALYVAPHCCMRCRPRCMHFLLCVLRYCVSLNFSPRP